MNASLRTKFLLVLLVGAVLPLAVVGWWLTGTAVRSGRALLRDQLNSAITGIASDMQAQWSQRSGELQLLANNVVVQSALSRPDTPLSSADSQYLSQLANAFRDAIAEARVVDASGRERWAFRAALPAVRDRGELGVSQSVPRLSGTGDSGVQSSLTFPVDIPVRLDDAQVVGTLRVRVRLASVLSSDSGQRAVRGAVFAALEKEKVLFTNAPDSIDPATPAAHPSWEMVTRSLDAMPLRLVLAARAAPFVEPFERAARLGLGVLLAVSLVALLISAMITSRVTGSMERLVVAAEAVAAGDLHRKVEVRSHDETGRLAGAFNAMTDSLRRTIAELSQQRSLAAVGEFAASLSHEVRNALTAMRIDLQHAGRQLPTDHAASPLVQRTLDTVRRLDATVTGALRIARSGVQSTSRVNVAALVRQAMRSAEPSFTASEATLEPLGDVPANTDVDGDAAALEQLFLNLLLNAAQALGASGRAVVTVGVEDGRVVVCISDNGPGFDASVLADQGSVLHTTKPGGTGLGLPIARRIAAAHEGDLLISSVVGGGTTVVVSLPSARAAPTA